MLRPNVLSHCRRSVSEPDILDSSYFFVYGERYVERILRGRQPGADTETSGLGQSNSAMI